MMELYVWELFDGTIILTITPQLPNYWVGDGSRPYPNLVGKIEFKIEEVPYGSYKG